MKIILVCNAGMSTGIMQIKLEECAKKDNIDAYIEAIPISEIETYEDDVDVILIGPQVRFAEDDIKNLFKDKALVFSIDLQDFGLMRADNVWKKIKNLLKI